MTSTGKASYGHKAAEPDMALWNALLAILPKQRPAKLPFHCGEAGGFHVILVDGGRVMLRERKTKETSHIGEPDFMDFCIGGNGHEDEELCGKDEVYIDGLMDASTWPFTGMHEIVEAKAMARGATYDAAHKQANIQEKALRRRFSLP